MTETLQVVFKNPHTSLDIEPFPGMTSLEISDFLVLLCSLFLMEKAPNNIEPLSKDSSQMRSGKGYKVMSIIEPSLDCLVSFLTPVFNFSQSSYLKQLDFK